MVAARPTFTLTSIHMELMTHTDIHKIWRHASVLSIHIHIHCQPITQGNLNHKYSLPTYYAKKAGLELLLCCIINKMITESLEGRRIRILK